MNCRRVRVTSRFPPRSRYSRGIAAQPDGLRRTPASSVTDRGWLTAQLAATATRYGFDRQSCAGVLWWYSVSSVLLGPPVSSVVRGGPVADPALESMVLYPHQDGRVLDARSTAVIPLSALGSRLHEALETVITEVASASGAPARALWAIATDSLANQVLWAGADPAVTKELTNELATELAASVGPPMPLPRYVTVGGTQVVRRASCCLIYQAPGQSKCTSCPRQHPHERARRLRAAFGQGGGSR